MWLITSIGFFSIVEKPTDRRSEALTIRARVKSDLVALRRDYMPSLGRIRDSSDTDYRYRATAARIDVSRALAQMVARLDYSNFKSEVAMRQGVERAHVYHDVWEALHNLQDNSAFEARPVNRRLSK